ESVKFTPKLKNFANSASEVFNVVISNFNPATMVTVRGKAGNAQETYNFLLSQTCGIPTPTRRIYWTNTETNMIGRANLDGQNVNQTFVIPGPVGLYGLAVDSSHIYWADLPNYTVGRAEMDGQNVNLSFISLPWGDFPRGVAVDRSHVYWTSDSGNVGRA